MLIVCNPQGVRTLWICSLMGLNSLTTFYIENTVIDYGSVGGGEDIMGHNPIHTDNTKESIRG